VTDLIDKRCIVLLGSCKGESGHITDKMGKYYAIMLDRHVRPQWYTIDGLKEETNV
jgi:hypothetical protein